MKISIDLDGCYTLDPALWDSFIADAKARGHEIICTTNRAFPPDGIAVPDIPLLLAGDSYKKSYADSLGHEVHVWIDDSPGTISPPLPLP